MCVFKLNVFTQLWSRAAPPLNETKDDQYECLAVLSEVKERWADTEADNNGLLFCLQIELSEWQKWNSQKEFRWASGPEMESKLLFL